MSSSKINLDDLIPMDIYQKEEVKLYECRTVVENDKLKELGFHEASHFVFSCLFRKKAEGFCGINFINICPEKINIEGYNVVNGFNPNLEMFGTSVEGFYNSDINRLLVKLTTLIAGFASFQIFIEDKEYFIGVPESTSEFKYYKVESSLNLGIPDIKMIQDKLKRHLDLVGKNQIIYIQKLIKEVQKLMKIQAINDSIRFVKNQLTNMKCENIEGAKLARLQFEVERFTNRINVDKYLDTLKEIN
jgi:hypothetical protein